MDAMSVKLEGVLKEAVGKGKMRAIGEKRPISQKEAAIMQGAFLALAILAAVLVHYGIL